MLKWKMTAFRHLCVCIYAYIYSFSNKKNLPFYYRGSMVNSIMGKLSGFEVHTLCAFW